MYTFLVALAILIVGYFVYGCFVESMFKPDNRKTPAMLHPDGVDYVPMNKWKAFLIQLLNIAGLGPIFGPITGAIWGPQVFLWIVFGTLFAGAVHDYMTGMLSMRNDGASVSELTGKYLGPVMLWLMRIFSVVLLVMVGVAFMVGPAQLLANLILGTATDFSGTGEAVKVVMGMDYAQWVKVLTVAILVYYFIATILPIDKVIGRIYPIFGICLLFMAVSVGYMTVMNHLNGSHPMIELWEGMYNMHPKAETMPIWPLMFITVACGAVSGFHATQSPMMARCLKSEREGRFVFYGAMVAEGIIGLIWAAAGVAFYHPAGTSFNEATAALLAAGGGGAKTVYTISQGLLGGLGTVLAMLGVIACPITSGDTAFRSARLTLADMFGGFNQKSVAKRLLLAVPLLGVGYLISMVDYGIVWRYFSWSNQTLAAIALWTAAAYLCRKVGPGHSLFAYVPAAFMTAVSVTYFCIAGECLDLVHKMSNGIMVSYAIGLAFAIACVVLFYVRIYAPATRGEGLIKD